MSKIIAIGDIHGKDIWKKIVANKSPKDIVVFIGDYLDSWDVPPAKQVSNFHEILEYKRQHMYDCILLIGNHDFHYMARSGDYERYSGWNAKTRDLLGSVLEDAVRDNLLQIAYEKDRNLFTHAGVTKKWLKRAGLEDSTNLTLAADINSLFKEDVHHFRFAVGADDHGDDPRNSPIWVRPPSLQENQVEGLNQIVGHTMIPQIYITPKFDHVSFIDVLDKVNEYLEITNGGVKIMRFI